MAHMACVDLPDRVAASLLELEQTRWRSALIQPVMVFFESLILFRKEMKRSLFPSLKGFVLTR